MALALSEEPRARVSIGGGKLLMQIFEKIVMALMTFCIHDTFHTPAVMWMIRCRHIPEGWFCKVCCNLFVRRA